MTYEKIVEKVKKALSKADASEVKEHLAVQVDVYGEGEGAFYIEVKDGKVEVQSYEYFDHDLRIRCTGDEIIALVEGKKKIIEYYDHEGEQLIKKAQFLAQRKKYDEALYWVSLIPQQSKHYDAALAAGQDIYQKYLNNECNINLAYARQAWAAEQNSSGAYAAGEYLANILPDAGCYDEAMELYREIKGKVLDDWKFEMKKYQDGVDLESQRIDAMRQVGVAYGNHQPTQTTNIEFLRTLL